MILKKGERLNRLKLIILITGILFLLLAGCKSEKEVQRAAPVKTPVIKKKKEVTAKKDSKDRMSAFTYIYDSEGKRDPFKSFIKKPKVEKIKHTDVPLTPLQKFDLLQLKLTAIISEAADDSENHAMVTDPTGKGYILKKGTLIGKNFGRVSRIDRDAVVVTEDIQDFLGNIITKEIPLTLETEGGE